MVMTMRKDINKGSNNNDSALEEYNGRIQSFLSDLGVENKDYHYKSQYTCEYKSGDVIKFEDDRVAVYLGEKYRIFDISVNEAFREIMIYRIGNASDYHCCDQWSCRQNLACTPSYVYADNEGGRIVHHGYKHAGRILSKPQLSSSMDISGLDDVWKLGFYDKPLSLALTSVEFIELVKILFRTIVAVLNKGALCCEEIKRYRCSYSFWSYEDVDFVCGLQEFVGGDLYT